MMRITTLKKMPFIRTLLFLAFVLGTSTNAFAGGSGYYDYWAQLAAYPSGAGKVYAKVINGNTLPEDNENYTDFTTPAQQVDVKYYAQNVFNYSFKGYAVPAEGWIFAGFAGAIKNESTGDYTVNFNVSVSSNPGDLAMNATTNADDEAAALTNFPLTPDTLYYAFFSHVVPQVAVGQAPLGTATVDKVVNELGDKVTLTATPINANTTRFAYWINKTTGAKITDNPLNVQVTDTVHYEAHFNCDSAFTINFPEKGGFAVVYRDTTFYLPDNVVEYNFRYNPDYYYYSDLVRGDSLSYDSVNQRFFFPNEQTGYQSPGGEPHVLYGKGEATFISDSVPGIDVSTKNELRYSGKNGVKADSLLLTHQYYSLNLEKQCFELMKLSMGSGIAPNTTYLDLPEERYKVFGVTEAPEVISGTTDVDPTLGINTVSADRRKASAKKGIYTVGGQKVSSAIRGLYIIDGKKVIKL